MAATRLTRRGLWVIVALALVVGSVGPLPPAEAAPAGVANVEIILSASQIGDGRTICVGDKVPIEARLIRIQEFNGNISTGPVLGVEIGASMDGSGVGNISPERITTNLDSDSLGAPRFTFLALKPGTATVNFQARVRQLVMLGFTFGGSTVTTSTTLTVEDCKYKVTTLSRWRVPGPANISAVAHINEAGMADTGGGLYAGTASVEWTIEASPVGDCTGTVTAAPSQAELLGQMNGPDEFTVQLGFKAAPVTVNQDCGAIKGSMQISLTPDPLSFSVLPSGGGRSLAQILQGPEPSLGDAIVMVKRATGQ